MGAEQITKGFIKRLHKPEQFVEMFDHLPDVYFFIKDRNHRFVLFNRTMLSLCGVRRVEDVVGKTDAHFFAAPIAEAYTQADRVVMQTKRPIVDLVEPVQQADGSVTWHVTNKAPLFGRDGDVIGVAVMTRDLHRAGESLQSYHEMSPILKYVELHYAEPIRTADLAGIVNLSVGQLERRFRAVVGLSPMQYVIRTRLNKACDALLHSDQRITHIALQCGFYDHSHFNKQFIRHTGESPRAYRKRHRH